MAAVPDRQRLIVESAMQSLGALRNESGHADWLLRASLANAIVAMIAHTSFSRSDGSCPEVVNKTLASGDRTILHCNQKGNAISRELCSQFKQGNKHRTVGQSGIISHAVRRWVFEERTCPHLWGAAEDVPRVIDSWSGGTVGPECFVAHQFYLIPARQSCVSWAHRQLPKVGLS